MPASDGLAVGSRLSALGLMLLALAHGVLFFCAFPPFDLWPFAFVATAPLAWLALRAARTSTAVGAVAAVHFLGWMWMHRWIADVTLIGYPLLAVYTTIYPCLFVWLLRRIDRRRIGTLPMAVILPVIWVGLECVRGKIVFHGYGWYLIGHPLIGSPALVQSADLLGSYFVGFIALTVSGAIVDVLRPLAPGSSRRTAIITVVAVALLQGANLGYGMWRLSRPPTMEAGPRVLAMQTNLPQSNKVEWTIEAKRRDMQSFIDETRRAVAEIGAADLIVWPETMLPVRGLDVETLQKLAEYGQVDQLAFAQAVFELHRDLGVPMLIGSPCYLGLDVAEDMWVWERHYNSAYLLDGPPPLQRYDKHALTPFGEMIPHLSAWPWLQEKLVGLGAPGLSLSLSGNPRISRLALRGDERSWTLAAPICFEDTLPHVCRRMVYPPGSGAGGGGPAKAVDALINLSNDGWFGSADSGRAQHLQVARFRCIENRVPLVRSANTGLSAVVDSSGNLVGRVGTGRYGEGRRAGWVFAALELDPRVTLYGRVGDGLAWACCGLLAIALLAVVRPAPKPRS